MDSCDGDEGICWADSFSAMIAQQPVGPLAQASPQRIPPVPRAVGQRLCPEEESRFVPWPHQRDSS
jgi:hypothetical protein